MVVTWSLCEQMLRGQPASCAGNGRKNSLASFQQRAHYDLRLTRSERLVLGGIHHELFGLPGARFVWRTILHLAAPHRSLLALTTAVVQLMLPSDQCRLGQRRRADRLVPELPAHVSRLTVSDPRLGCGRHCGPCHPSPNRLTTNLLKTTLGRSLNRNTVRLSIGGTAITTRCGTCDRLSHNIWTRF
jgi:hypothetical protein